MINRLPLWFKQEIPGEKALKLAGLFSKSGINTVCREAKCPNINECFGEKKATFLILGNACTRNCGFCNVKKPAGFSNIEDEPHRISSMVKELGLEYAVITSVTRDDLPDAGAGIFAKTIRSIRALNRKIKVEVLIPDFCGKILSLRKVLEAGPDVLAHNIETVSRLYKDLRPMADYRRSLMILDKSKELRPGITTKSSLMLGLGERKPEVIRAMKDLRRHSCDILTLGQYLAPTPGHYPVKEFINIEQFADYKAIGLGLGFKAVFSGPKVRSSYQAEKLLKESSYV